MPMFGDHPVEMGMAGHADALTQRLDGNPCYRRLFARIFPETDGAIDAASIAKAIAAFERTLLSFDAPYDRYRRGDRGALSASAQRGMALFFDGFGCSGCHSGPAFSGLGGPELGYVRFSELEIVRGATIVKIHRHGQGAKSQS